MIKKANLESLSRSPVGTISPWEISNTPRDQQIRQLFERAAISITTTVPHRITNETAAVASVMYTLRVYGRYMPPEEFLKFLRFFSKPPVPKYTVFSDKKALQKFHQSLGDHPDVLPGYPISRTIFPKRTQGADRFNRVLGRMLREGSIAFSQSEASGLPFWLVQQARKEGYLHLDRETRILDICGAPGNKTLNFLHLPGVNKKTAIINDTSPTRLARVEERLLGFGFRQDMGNGAYHRDSSQTGHTTVYLTSADATSPDQLQGLIDRYFIGTPANIVIADVDCPGDGRIYTASSFAARKHPKTIADIQAQIKMLKGSLSVVAPSNRGIVSYSTCSVNPLMNEGVVGTVLQENRLIRPINTATDGHILCPPVFEYRGIAFDPRVRGVRAYPHIMGDGFFCSLLMRAN